MSGGGKDREETLRSFDEAVNMTAGELEKWLKTEESRWRHSLMNWGHDPAK
ncbi:DUF3140 domain-containing protein [Streptomyces lavendulocolor]|uniref:DUF3140 domain-containing protein n=1 Tax=Streptomyces lavendulocolor TaxID=67316 RepID=UPI003C2B1889